MVDLIILLLSYSITCEIKLHKKKIAKKREFGKTGILILKRAAECDTWENLKLLIVMFEKEWIEFFI